MNNLTLKYSSYYLFTLIAATLFLTPFLTTSAQEPSCGSIIGPDETVEITDCSNPFGAVSDPGPFILSVEGVVVGEGDLVTVPESGTNAYSIETQYYMFGSDHKFFLREGNDYILVESEPFEAVEEDYRRIAAEYFADDVSVEPYVQREMGNFADTEDGAWDWDLYYGYSSYFNENFVPSRPPLVPGDYTLVSTEINGYSTQNDVKPLLQKFLDFVIPTAYAQYYFAEPVYVLNFTLAVEVEPKGASSVLFLPGIMGSRLYENSNECGFGVKERERWSSFSECDQLRLKTNYLGQSLNDIYTYADEASVLDEMNVAFGAGPNIYKSFLEDLNDWKNEDKISDYLVVPYDWRLRLDDLVKMKRDPVTNKITLDSSIEAQDSYLYEALSRLSQNSQSDKVTVVAHSNGGLLIKYLLQTLEADDPILSKIDNIILVAVPQEGTPESLVGMLHGVDIGAGGIVMNSQTSRILMKDAPFGFQLLPTQKYFDSVITPVITIESGLSTDVWKSQFGEIINSYDLMRNFLVKESGREDPSDEDTLQPAVIDSYAFDYKNFLADAFYNWEAPEGVKVYQVAGTGVDTPSGITYFTDVACVESSWFTCDKYEKKLGYRINPVLDGDGTVVTPSALSMSKTDEVERWWVDLNKYNNEVTISRIHRDIFEVTDVRDFVYNIAASSSASALTYIKDTPPVYVKGERLIFQLHSPLDMYAVLSDGSVVGSSTESVRGAYYRRFGEVQQLSIPATETNYILYLSGQSSGSFSLDVEKYTGSSLNDRHTYSAIPSSASTKVEFPVESINDVNSSTSLSLDYDGDGTVDVKVSIWTDPESDDDGSQIATSTPEVGTDTESKGSSGTKVGYKEVDPTPLVAGVTISINPTQTELLQQIVILLQQYRDLLVVVSRRNLK